jgi:protein-tyrosine phosphatase
LDRLVEFLDSKHGGNWAIWEFRAEGTGYPDDAVYGRIRHYPWPDHHPPPFRLVPMILASMRNWLHGGDLESGGAVGVAADAQIQTENGKQAGKEREDGSIDKKEGRVVVVHCKAGKGRSGTISCSYLISEEGWKPEDALARFTERRMRPNFGAGVSIPSQLRWITYVERWAAQGKKYVDREIEIVEIHVWGLRNGVKIDIRAFEDEGKKIVVKHTFKKFERIVVEGNPPGGGGVADMARDMAGYAVKPVTAPEEAELADSANADKSGEGEARGDGDGDVDGKDKDAPVPERPGSAPPERSKSKRLKAKATNLIKHDPKSSSTSSLGKAKAKTIAAVSSASSSKSHIPLDSPSAKDQDAAAAAAAAEPEPGGMAVILKPEKPVHISNGDVNISVERRNRAQLGLTMVTAVAHVWINTFFEGHGPEQDGAPDASGVFEIDWDAMDGIKGSSRKGTRALDRMAVVWRAVGGVRSQDGGDEVESGKEGEEVLEPTEGSPVPQMKAADWKGGNREDPEEGKDLGLRVQSPESADISRASSIKSSRVGSEKGNGDADSLAGVKTSGPLGEAELDDSLGELSLGKAKEEERGAESEDVEEEVKKAGQPGPELIENPDTASATTAESEAKVVK